MLLRLRDRQDVIVALTLHSSSLYTESQDLKLIMSSIQNINSHTNSSVDLFSTNMPMKFTTKDCGAAKLVKYLKQKVHQNNISNSTFYGM
jgi:hypothetical protein